MGLRFGYRLQQMLLRAGLDEVLTCAFTPIFTGCISLQGGKQFIVGFLTVSVHVYTHQS